MTAAVAATKGREVSERQSKARAPNHAKKNSPVKSCSLLLGDSRYFIFSSFEVTLGPGHDEQRCVISIVHPGEVPSMSSTLALRL